MTHIFSAVQQVCLTLKMEAIRPFEASGTAPHPSRTKQSATPLTEPEITQQYILLSQLPNQLSPVPLTNCQLYSHCNCLQYCFEINSYCMNCFCFNSWNFYYKYRSTWSACNKSTNCGPRHYVKMVLQNHFTRPTIFWGTSLWKGFEFRPVVKYIKGDVC